jgi:hypothetical protein
MTKLGRNEKGFVRGFGMSPRWGFSVGGGVGLLASVPYKVSGREDISPRIPRVSGCGGCASNPPLSEFGGGGCCAPLPPQPHNRRVLSGRCLITYPALRSRLVVPVSKYIT